ncbi:hypothetical protein Syun_030099 [Stephania yunnanensis]|uniref:Uncharacterized protein n=1 Tax=Stephania yunnanensis TaxID=152371 RepID=A0AAP0HLZ7_9MAGN
MKASLKFREDQKPLLKAKIPLNILGFPFQSGVAAGDTNELSLHLSTFFESGPSLKLNYRPNDSLNPFSLVVRTGIGSFGSPFSAPMSMSAEFNLLTRENPKFLVHFRPQIGDFRIKKSIQSPSPSPVVFTPLVAGSSSKEFDSDLNEVNGVGGDGVELLAEKSVCNGLFNGAEITAKTVLPVRRTAVVGFRWGMRLPAAAGATASFRSFRNPFEGKGGLRNPTAVIPFLVMDKISIEHVAEERPKIEGVKRGPLEGEADVARVCLGVKREMEVLRSESDSLRRAVEGLRSEMGGKFNSGNYREAEHLGGKRLGGKSVRDPDVNNVGKAAEGDVGEELKKALMGSSSAGM